MTERAERAEAHVAALLAALNVALNDDDPEALEGARIALEEIRGEADESDCLVCRTHGHTESPPVHVPAGVGRMNPLTYHDVPILRSLLVGDRSQEQRALLHRLIVAADGGTDVEVATAGTEAARILERQRQTIIEQQVTISTERHYKEQALAELRHATRPRREWLPRFLLARAWDLGFIAGYADGTDTGPTNPPNPYSRRVLNSRPPSR